MTNPTATISTDGRMLDVRFPYDNGCKEALKAAIPWQERAFENPPARWLVQPQHLATVQRIISDTATARGWRVADATQHSAATLAADQAAAEAADRAQHIAAFLAVLPQLPPRSLALVACDEQRGVWELELRQHLDEALFRAVLAASLRGRRETMLGSWDQKRAWGFKLDVAADEQVLRALIARGDVAHLRVYDDLRIVATFDDGAILHLARPDGTAYVGERWDTADLGSWNAASDAWPLAALPGGVYVVFGRAAYVRSVLGESATGWAGFGGAFAVATPRRSGVAAAVVGLHLSDWFRGWACALVADPAVTRDRWRAGAGRKATDYHHPADALLSHIRRFRPADVLALLGWSDADVTQAQAQIDQGKADAAAAQVADERARAPELARPLLTAMTKADLLALAAQHDITLAKSAKKDALVTALLGVQAVCEDVIGVPQDAGVAL